MTLALQLLPLLLLVVFSAATVDGQPLSSESKLCKSVRVSTGEYYKHLNLTHLHMTLTKNFAGCQYVHGDLIIENVGADPITEEPLAGDIRMLNTDFLDSVVEITGRLVIRRVNLERITLKNLRAIRGYNPENIYQFYAVEIWQSKYPMQLRMPKLSAILQGNVRIVGSLNADLYCPLSRLIDWPSLFQSANQKFTDDVVLMRWGNKDVNVSDYRATESVCSTHVKCDSSCHEERPRGRLCWSSGPDGCQSYSRCGHRKCNSQRCFINPFDKSEECCHNYCLGGCISERPDGCFSCMQVSHDGSCMDKCPPKFDYNPGTNRIETHNSSMWRVGNICVKKCEMPFVASSVGQFCLSECPKNEIPTNGVCTGCAAKNQAACIQCDTNVPILTDVRAQELRREGCTVWRTDASLDVNVERLKSNASLEALELLQIFYGRLYIKRTDYLVKDLRFLRNLKFVSGNFAIMMTNTQYLGLANLRYAKFLVLMNITGLCPGWYPTKHINESAKLFTISIRDVSFDNSSAECQRATCDILCRDECWGPGPEMCVACKHFAVGGRCYATCQDADSYAVNATCLPCHTECMGGCHGPAATQCVRCRNQEEDGTCVATCSREMRAGSSGRCYSTSSVKLVIVGAVVGVLVLALLISLPFAYKHYRKRIQRYEMVDLDEYLTDPKNPSDMAKLLIVNDDDVVKQKEIGSGAFGTVFKGVLRSSTIKGVRELPVAIKVLRGHSPKLGQELLNEASVLARVRHPCCIRLVALCLTQEPQLITALMPRGCLLEFVRAHRNRIGAERMLRWSLQVAEGMQYLESLGIVHRDLAARNVLLQTPEQVRITDFGLARLLDIAEGEFVQTAGLLPVKWLGVECFESGLFSHKSDVWSYGVLLWEICTFGESPYNPYGIRSVEDITDLLKKGIRLNQPDICSIDFYNILLSCWLPHPDSRPSFNDLVGTMNECLLHPPKYIANRRSTMDPNIFDADDAPGFESELTKPSQKKAVKQQQQNSYISDPTNQQQPKLRHPPWKASPGSDPCENALLLRTLSNDDPDGYLTPKSPTRPEPDGGNEAKSGLDDYLTPRKA